MFPQLTTSRLVLKQILPSDQQFIFEGLSNPEVIHFYGVRYDTFDLATTQMEWYDQMMKEGSGIAWKIVDKETGNNIGVVTIYFYKPLHKKAEAGFWILPEFWNRGYASEALLQAIDYWKKEKKIHRLEAFVEEGNQASCRMLEKSGFKFEGRMKDCEVKDGKFISLEIYALLLDY